MESNNQTDAPATDLCRSCKAFYGSRDRGYLCSSCFKDQKEPIVPEVKSQVQRPVDSTLSDAKESYEESKECALKDEPKVETQP